MYKYTAYGLGIQSDLLFPELILDYQSECDVIIRKGETGTEPTREVGTEDFAQFKPEEVFVSLTSVGKLRVQGGCRIIYSLAPDANLFIARACILGIGMAILLYQRGLFVLHGSAVSIAGRAILFIGDSGAGKSSMAAGLHGLGYKLLTDDVSAIQANDGTLYLCPGYPQLKLSREMAASLQIQTQNIRPIYQSKEEISFSLREEQLRLHPTPMSCIYSLSFGEEERLERLTAQAALLELLRQSMPTRLGISATHAHFIKCVQVVKSVPVYRLTRPAAIQLVPELARRVEAHFVRLI